LSASVSRKSLTVSLVEPEALASSAMMAFLSPGVSWGAARTPGSFASLVMRLPRLAIALDVGSRVDVLTAAVY